MADPADFKLEDIDDKEDLPFDKDEDHESEIDAMDDDSIGMAENHGHLDDYYDNEAATDDGIAQMEFKEPRLDEPKKQEKLAMDQDHDDSFNVQNHISNMSTRLLNDQQEVVRPIDDTDSKLIMFEAKNDLKLSAEEMDPLNVKELRNDDEIGVLHDDPIDMSDYHDVDGDDNDPDATFDGLPEWADQESVHLNESIKQQESAVDKYNEESINVQERMATMSAHLLNVQHELTRTQELLDAKASMIESEDHLKRLAEQELSRLEHDVQCTQKEIVAANQKIHSMQNEMFANNDKLERFKLQKNWNQEELDQWALAAKQKEEDGLAIERYRRADQAKIKQASLQIKHLTTEIHSLEHQLNQEVTETQSAQIELDKTSTDFRLVHVDRQSIVDQWEQTEQLIIRRDEEISALSEVVDSLQSEIRERTSRLVQADAMVKQEKLNNQSIELSIGSGERAVEKARIQFQSERESINNAINQRDTLRLDLQQAIGMLARAKQSVATARQMQADKLSMLDQVERRTEATRTRLAAEFSKTDDIEERSRQIRTLLHESETQNHAADASLHSFTHQMFKHSQQLHTARKEESNWIADISGAQVSLRNLQGQIEQLDTRSLAQQEVLYNIEFAAQQLERKVSRASGQRTIDETIALKAKIADLSDELAKESAQERLLGQQVKRIQSSLRASQRHLQSMRKDLISKNDQLNELQLENQTSELQMVKFEAAKDDLVVQSDVLRLDAKRLESRLHERIDQVFALENRQMQLAMSMQEKERDVSLLESVQKGEQKIHEEGRHRVHMEVQERIQRRETLRAKFDAIAGRLRGDGLSGDQERSQAFYMIQAAQQRDELQRAGDILNDRIKRATRDLRVLAAAEQDMRKRNQVYRASFHKADMTGDDAQKMSQLQAELNKCSDRLSKKRAYLRELQSDFESGQHTLAEVQDDLTIAEEEYRRTDRAVIQAHEGLQQQVHLLDRSRRSVSSIDGESAGDSVKSSVLIHGLQQLAECLPDLQRPIMDVINDIGAGSKDGQ